MDFQYTKHRVPRSARADGETRNDLFLLKNVSSLRLTYQIRLLSFRASESRKGLVIQVPKHCKIHPSLRDFARELAQVLRIEKV
jgi:hypothetical protein